MNKNKSEIQNSTNASMYALRALKAFIGSVLAIIVGIVTFPILGEAVFAGFQMAKYFQTKGK